MSNLLQQIEIATFTIVGFLLLAACIAILVTVPKVVKTQGWARTKMLLVGLYTAGVLLWLDDKNGFELAERHGQVDGAEPLIFGTWQLFIGWGIIAFILALQLMIAFKDKRREPRRNGGQDR